MGRSYSTGLKKQKATQASSLRGCKYGETVIVFIMLFLVSISDILSAAAIRG
jgi:hypothetical protein